MTTSTVSGALTPLGDTISAALILADSGTFNIGNNHDLTLSGGVSGGSITKTGLGDLYLTSVAPSLSGLTIDNGSVRFDNSSASGLNGLQVQIGGSSSASLRFITTGSGSPVSLSTSILMGNDASINPVTFSNIVFTSSTFNAANGSVTTPKTLTLAGGALGNAGTQTINGVIQDNSGGGKVNLQVASTSNVWVLNGINTYTGSTSIASGGSLLMNGVINGSSTTTSSGYLGGSGTFNGVVNILAGGTLAPGGTSTQGGTITDTNARLQIQSLTLFSGALTQMAISGTATGGGVNGYDQIYGSGTIIYGGNLSLTMSGSFADYTEFSLFDGYGSRPGSFLNVALSPSTTGAYAGLTFTNVGSASQWDIDHFHLVAGDWITNWNSSHQRLIFSESRGTLTVVPEPSTVVFAGIGMAMFGWSTWTRRRAKARKQVIEASIA